MAKTFKELKTLNGDLSDSIYEEDSLITETGVSFRDRVSNIDKQGKRIWIYPKKPSGNYHKWRAIVAVFLISIMVILPFIKLNGNPFVLLDVLQRKFIIFGVIFWPQDFHIFALSLLALVIFAVLFTAVYGRIWCGWACPQTIFMEMVFRKIEYWIEGDAKQQMELAKAPMDGKKFLKRVAKHGIFLTLAFLISNLVLSYIIGIDKLSLMISEGPFVHVGTFVAIVGNTAAFYFVYSWFREQACTFVCPYGRLQSVLIDKSTVVVAYDYKRGEKREKFKKQQSEAAGDCIDCGACVRVCPTGIDIRNGTQLECVNCTACIDACDDVMTKVKRPNKLIKYASLNNIEEGTRFRYTPRMILYSVVLALLIGLVIYLMTNRSQVEATILKAKGSTFQFTDEEHIANIYTVTLINKSFEPMELNLKLMEIAGTIKVIGGKEMKIDAGGVLDATLLVEVERKNVSQTRNNILIGLYSGDKLIEKISAGFTGPVPGMDHFPSHKNEDQKHKDEQHKDEEH